MADVERIYTETPLIDEIVYQIKGMIIDGIVLKDIEEANNNETLYSIKMSDKYADIVEGKDKYELWEYDYDTIIKLPSITKEMAIMYAMNNALIDDASKPLLLKYKQEEFMETYEEQNNYYRMLHGDPNYDPTGAWEGLWIDINTIEEGVVSSSVSPYYIDTPGTDYRPFSELSNSYVEILYDNGTIDSIVNNSDQLSAWGLTKDDVLYLNHLGARSIDYYDARVADRFELLY